MKQGKKSILFEWAGSYVIVLVISLITIFLNYYLNMETIRSEIYSANEVVLDNLGNEIDRIMAEQENLYNYLYVDDFFSSWVSHREQNPEFYYDASRLIFARYLNSVTDEKCLVYADSLALSGNKLVNIFINVSLEKIAELTTALDSQAYLVMNYDNQVEVVGADESIISPQLQELICSGEGNFETDEYMGIVKQSTYKGFSYCMLIAQEDFWTKSEHIRNVFLLSIVITLLVAFGAVSFLLRRNFMPVSRLLEKVSGGRQRGNEFYQIELAYSMLKNENKSMQQILQGQKEALLGSYLLAVMKGRRRRLSGNEIEFFELDKGKSAILCGFCVTSEDELLRFAMDNVFSELMEREHFCRMEDVGYMLYLFFVEPGKEEEFADRCDSRIAFMAEIFKEKWKISLEFRKTTPEPGLDRMESLYRRLMREFSGQDGAECESDNANEEIRGIVADILEYVETNYNDSNLNISAIADSINKNPKYISRVFKETMGEGILDHVNQIRITKAKEIIATRRYSMEEAGAMAGYASNQTFRRAFMKIVGTTPGKYMDSLQNQGGGKN